MILLVEYIGNVRVLLCLIQPGHRLSKRHLCNPVLLRMCLGFLQGNAHLRDPRQGKYQIRNLRIFNSTVNRIQNIQGNIIRFKFRCRRQLRNLLIDHIAGSIDILNCRAQMIINHDTAVREFDTKLLKS